MTIGLISGSDLLAALAGNPSQYDLIDARDASDFEKGHLPGAINLQWEDWCARPPSGLKAELSEPGYWGCLTERSDQEVSSKLSNYGLANSRTIVVYAAGPASKGREGRIAWMLLYFGAEQVLLLDGGINAWLEAGGRLHSAADQAAASGSTKAEGKFIVKRVEERRIRLAELKQLLESGLELHLLDTRSAAEYKGDSYPYMPRPGSLPGAFLLPYVSVFAADQRFLDKERFGQLLPERSKDSRLISFCEVGVRACTVALLHEIYSGQLVPVYDGSMMEWGADSSLPVVRS